METIKTPSKWKIEISLFFTHAFILPLSSFSCFLSRLAISRVQSAEQTILQRVLTPAFISKLCTSAVSARSNGRKILLYYSTNLLCILILFAYREIALSWHWICSHTAVFTDATPGRVSCQPKWERTASPSYLLCNGDSEHFEFFRDEEKKAKSIKIQSQPFKMTISTDRKTKNIRIKLIQLFAYPKNLAE